MITTQMQAMLLKVRDRVVWIPLDVTLSWDEDNDPLAVQMIISKEEDDDVVWHFAHSLLIEGLNASKPVGLGDVKFKRTSNTGGDHVVVCLKNLEGHADLALPHGMVEAFLEATLAEDFDEAHFNELCDEAIKEMLEDEA